MVAGCLWILLQAGATVNATTEEEEKASNLRIATLGSIQKFPMISNFCLRFFSKYNIYFAITDHTPRYMHTCNLPQFLKHICPFYSNTIMLSPLLPREMFFFCALWCAIAETAASFHWLNFIFCRIMAFLHTEEAYVHNTCNCCEIVVDFLHKINILSS